MTAATIRRLDDLRGFRGAPPLSPEQREQLRVELRQRLAACDWCTIGVMAPSSGAAREALRSFERALGWPVLDTASLEATSGPVFLKGQLRKAVDLAAQSGEGFGLGTQLFEDGGHGVLGF